MEKEKTGLILTLRDAWTQSLTGCGEGTWNPHTEGQQNLCLLTLPCQTHLDEK